MPPDSQQNKRWAKQPRCPNDHLHKFSHLHPLLVQILYNRGIREADDVSGFLTGTARFEDPNHLLDMQAAVERIQAAIHAGERIVVYGDYDADGVTATALLVQVLQAMGAQRVAHQLTSEDGGGEDHYLPHRVEEGYGLNCEALRKIAAWGARLVVTVDCGVRSVQEVAYANDIGLDVIVTDHHAPGPELPPALAVVNPRRPGDGYHFKDLAGVGVAFKLAQALLLAEQHGRGAGRPLDLQESDLLDLVALGTVADVVPLLGENRWLVQRGLVELNKAHRPGVAAMLEEAGLEPGRVDAGSIGYVLGPRLNAAGRLETARVSYGLLTARDMASAADAAERLGELNRQRQEETRLMLDRARGLAAAGEAGGYLYLLADEGFKRGVAGLVASRLAEELYRPVLIAELGAEHAVGSARSIPDFNITAALDACADLLVRHGGHARAAGFTVERARLPELRARLQEMATSQLSGTDLVPELQIDAEVALSDLSWAVQGLLAQLEPCGHGNPPPLLASLGLEVVTCRQVGHDGHHLKLAVRDPHASGRYRTQAWDAIAFRQGDWFTHLRPAGPLVDLAYSLEANEFNGDRRLQLNVKDIRLHQTA